jgi:hypothetical protein
MLIFKLTYTKVIVCKSILVRKVNVQLSHLGSSLRQMKKKTTKPRFPARRLVDVGNSGKIPARWLAGVMDSGEIQRGSSP